MAETNNEDVITQVSKKTAMLEKILKKKPLSDRLQFVNLFIVLNMAIHDSLIFLNIVEQMFVANFSAWKSNKCDNAKTILFNILHVLSNLCKLIS